MTPKKIRRIRIRKQVIKHRRVKNDYRRIAKKAMRRLWTQWRQAKRVQVRELGRHPFRRRGLSAWVKRMLGLDRLKPAPADR